MSGTEEKSRKWKIRREMTSKMKHKTVRSTSNVWVSIKYIFKRVSLVEGTDIDVIAESSH